MLDTKEQRKYEYSRRIIGFTSGFTVNDSKNAIEESLYRSFGQKPFNFGVFEKSNPADDDKVRKYVTSQILIKLLKNVLMMQKKSTRKNIHQKINQQLSKVTIGIYLKLFLILQMQH